MSLNLFYMNSNVEELMHYQRRRDLRAQAACEHITPVTALKDRVKRLINKLTHNHNYVKSNVQYVRVKKNQNK